MLMSAEKVGGSKKGQKHADVILEWSPSVFLEHNGVKKFWSRICIRQNFPEMQPFSQDNSQIRDLENFIKLGRKIERLQKYLRLKL